MFNEAVRGVDLADFTLTRSTNDTTLVLLGSATLTTVDNITWTLGNLGPLTSTAGRYRLAITGAGSWIMDLAGDPLVVGTSERWTNGPGDANQDGQFDQFDIIAVLTAGKYLTGEAASWGEGDWNGDERFDQSDLVLAQQTQPSHYRQGPFSAVGQCREPHMHPAGADWLQSIHVPRDGDGNIDQVFAQLGTAAALQSGNYLREP